MIERIHVDPKLEKCLAALRKGSRRASLVADRVEAIIAALECGGTQPGDLCTYTRNGEARIKGCLKVDLGAGYRLVTLKHEQDLFLLYAGTHDACMRWIENNHEHMLIEVIAERCRTIRRPTGGEKGSSWRTDKPPSCDHDEDWLPPIDDRDLRIIFRGLIQGAEKQRQ